MLPTPPDSERDESSPLWPFDGPRPFRLSAVRTTTCDIYPLCKLRTSRTVAGRLRPKEVDCPVYHRHMHLLAGAQCGVTSSQSAQLTSDQGERPRSAWSATTRRFSQQCRFHCMDLCALLVLPFTWSHLVPRIARHVQTAFLETFTISSWTNKQGGSLRA